MGSLLADPDVNEADVAEALNGEPSLGLQIGVQSGAITSGLGDAFRRFGQGRGELLSPEQANRDFGVEGQVTFERPTYEDTAAMRQHAGQRAAFREDVLGRSHMGTLGKIGTALTGGLLDPAGLPLVFAPELVGLRGALEAAPAFRAGGVLAKGGRIANAGRYGVIGGIEGFVGTGIYEVGALGAGGDALDDASMGDALRNMVLGAGVGVVLGGALGGAFGERGHPRAVRELPEESRLAATLLALDNATADRPVDVAAAIERETPPTPKATLARLDDADGPRIAQRELEADVAVTSRGREVPVKYALVELDDLVTSHTDDLERNPAFPEALQPRDRTRAGAQAANRRLESEAEPQAADARAGRRDRRAADRPGRHGGERQRPGDRAAPQLGAPGAAPTTATGRAARPRASTPPAWTSRCWCACAGDDDRRGPRAAAREMNAASTEAMGAGEQAMADAAQRSTRPCCRIWTARRPASAPSQAFIRRIAPDQQNSLADAEGRLSMVGRQRTAAALVARAYDDPRLVEAVFEAADPNIKTLGASLTEAAPAWAAMRELAAAGKIPVELDVTEHLRAAVDLIRHARDNRIPVDEWIAQRLDQSEHVRRHGGHARGRGVPAPVLPRRDLQAPAFG
jgi:hypothetical protein